MEYAVGVVLKWYIILLGGYHGMYGLGHNGSGFGRQEKFCGKICRAPTAFV